MLTQPPQISINLFATDKFSASFKRHKLFASMQQIPVKDPTVPHCCPIQQILHYRSISLWSHWYAQHLNRLSDYCGLKLVCCESHGGANGYPRQGPDPHGYSGHPWRSFRPRWVDCGVSARKSKKRLGILDET